MEVLAGALAAMAGFFAGVFAPLHYVRMAPVPTQEATPVAAVTTSTTTILFGGDMMFDRTIRTAAAAHGDDYLFACLDPLLWRADLVVANLEGPITASSSRSVGSAIGAPDNYVFTFPTTTAQLLARHNIRIVNVGNNHITNFGTDGVRSTIRALSESQVSYFGDPLIQRVATTTARAVPLSFINYNEFDRASTASTTVQQIQEARAAQRVPIVYTHWGIEYAATSTPRAQRLAHAFVDAGAAAVIGSHPHVVQEHETYRGAPIYYSLGNMIFDQYWSAAVSHGLMLEMAVSPNGVEGVREVPVVLGRDRRTCPVE